MRKIVFIIFVVNLLDSISGYCLDIPQDLQQEVATAIKNGKALYEASLKGPIANEGIEKEKTKIKDFCEFKYNAYIVNGSIYFIAEASSSENIVFGRHYKISGDVIIPSTKTCFISAIEPPGKDVVGAFATHLLSNAPSEFHVFLSLKYKKPIYVGTSKGTWKVEFGAIEFVKESK